jgi:hypothetical protein
MDKTYPHSYSRKALTLSFSIFRCLHKIGKSYCWLHHVCLPICSMITSTLQEDLYTFFIISCSVLLRIRNVSDKNCRESHNTRFMFNNIFSKIVAVYETLKKHCKGRQPQMTTGCMHITRWIPKATNMPSKHVIFIAFLLQQWLHKHVSMLHYERPLPVLFHKIYVCPVLITTVTDVQ